MALPVEYATVTLAGKYVDLSGAPAAGSVTFEAPTVLSAAASDVLIVPKPFTVALDGTGAFTVVLPATDDPDISPTFTYKVSERFTSPSLLDRVYYIEVPFDTVGTLQLADIAPAAPIVSGAAYLTKASADSLYASVSVHEGPLDLTGRYGIDNTASTPCQIAMQAALDALKNTSADGNRAHGAAGFLRPGRYQLTSTVMVGPNVEVIGMGGSGFNLTNQAMGATIIDVHVSGGWGITADGSGEVAGAMYRGPVFRNINFYGSGGSGCSGVKYTKVNNFLFDNCTFNEFATTGGSQNGVGFYNVGPYNSYGVLRDCRFEHNLTSLWNYLGDGLRIYGGLMDGVSTKTAGWTGIRDQGRQTLVHGTVFRGWETAIYVQGVAAYDPDGPEAVKIKDCHFEGFTRGVKSEGYGTVVAGSSFNNFGWAHYDGSDYAAEFTAASQRCRFMPDMVRAVSHLITDAGTGNAYFDPSDNSFHGFTAPELP